MMSHDLTPRLRLVCICKWCDQNQARYAPKGAKHPIACSLCDMHYKLGFQKMEGFDIHTELPRETLANMLTKSRGETT